MKKKNQNHNLEDTNERKKTYRKEIKESNTAAETRSGSNIHITRSTGERNEASKQRKKKQNQSTTDSHTLGDYTLEFAETETDRHTHTLSLNTQETDIYLEKEATRDRQTIHRQTSAKHKRNKRKIPLNSNHTAKKKTTSKKKEEEKQH